MSTPFAPFRVLLSKIGAGSFDRLKLLLPPWFGDDRTPVLDAVLQGPSTVLDFIFNLIQYVRIQTRIQTASDGFLDLISADYFGDALPRQAGETDNAFRTRIKAALFPPKNTRPALVAALTALTGITFTVIEPWSPGDTGAWNTTSTTAYNIAGRWGSRTSPYQCFVTVHVGSSGVTANEIYAAIEAVRPAGVMVWVRIQT